MRSRSCLLEGRTRAWPGSTGDRRPPGCPYGPAPKRPSSRCPLGPRSRPPGERADRGSSRNCWPVSSLRRSSGAVMAASPSLPGGSSCEPTWNQTRKEIVGSPATGSSTGGAGKSAPSRTPPSGSDLSLSPRDDAGARRSRRRHASAVCLPAFRTASLVLSRSLPSSARSSVRRLGTKYLPAACMMSLRA